MDHQTSSSRPLKVDSQRQTWQTSSEHVNKVFVLSGRAWEYSPTYLCATPKGYSAEFGLKTGVDLWSGIGYGLRGRYGSVRTYLLFQFQMSKKEKEICEFEWIALLLL